MSGKHSTRNAAVAVALILVIAVYGNSLGWFTSLTTPATGSINNGANSVVTTTTVGGQGLKDGDLVTVNVNAVDALTGAALTEATNTKSVWLYKSNVGAYTIQTTGTAKTIKVSADGKIWADLEAQASGQTFIFSPAKTVAAESTFNNDCTYGDVEGDGTKEYICSFSTTGLTPQAANFGVIPTRNFNTAWFDYTAASISSPADVSSIGTTAGTSKFTTWTLTNTVGDVSTPVRIQYKLNSTSDSKWSAGDMYISFKNVGLTIPLSSMAKSQDGTNTYYECLLGPTGNCTGGGYLIPNAYILQFATNGSGLQDIEVKNVWNLATSDVIATTLIINQVNEIDGAPTALSDLKNNSA